MNVVLIAIDTLRADALSCYGNAKPTSPNLDALASRGTLFENFYSVGNCTHPGFTAMLTGMYPESTGVVSHWTGVEPEDDVSMMAEVFKRAGYVTGAIDNLYDGWRPRHPFYPWFRRGYDHYDYPRNEGHYQPGSEVSGLACDWIREGPGEPFFLFIHYWDPHAPYNKAPGEYYRFYDGPDPCDPGLDYMPPNIRESQRRTFGIPVTDPGYVVAAYYAETSYVDACVGMVLGQLEESGLSRDTLVAVTSDHGDIMPFPRIALGCPWAFCHIGLNEDCLRLPLIFSGPGVEEGGRIGSRFQLVDLLPSLLEAADIPVPEDLDGQSFASGLEGDPPFGRDHLFFSENTYQKQRAVLEWPWKYMRMEAEYNSMPPRSLFNLEMDPLEMANLSDEEVDTMFEMDSILDDYVARTTGDGADPLKVQDLTAGS
jgi:arylsulfatase A-like enzyme